MEVRIDSGPAVEQGRPLTGIKVMDLTRAASAPFAMLILGLLGAEIVKVQDPVIKTKNASFAGSLHDSDSMAYALLHHEKKSVTLNLKTEIGLEIAKEMVKKFDILAEDMSLGTIERLGLGYDVVMELNPRIIYASNKGFGRSGKYKNYRAFDATVQCMGGVVHVNGFPGNPPCKVGPAIGDWAAGLYLAIGIMAALRLRDTTGKGCMIDTSMQEAVASLLIDHYNVYQQWGRDLGRGGNAPYAPRPDLQNPKALYETKDGYLYILSGDDKQWELLLKAIGQEYLNNDPRFADRIKRCENREAIDELLQTWIKDKTKFEALDILGAAGITAGAVLNLAETLNDPHMNARGFFKELEHHRVGKTKVFGLPIKLSNAPTDPCIPAPIPNQHNEEIYGGLMGYSKEEIASLEKLGAI